jgi:hypothetical protein
MTDSKRNSQEDADKEQLVDALARQLYKKVANLPNSI